MTSSKQAFKISPWEVFRSASYTRMWLAQLASTIGDSFTYIAAGILIYQRTGSVFLVGLVEIAAAVPMMLLGTFAGVIVDRFDRKKIMVFADCLRGILLFLIPFLVNANLAWIFVLLFLNSALNSFFQTSYDSIVPEMVSDEALSAANSMLSISSFGSTAVGFIASGLLAEYSINVAFLINAAAYIIAAVLLMGIQLVPFKKSENTSAGVIMKDLKTGLKYIGDHRILLALLNISMLYAFMAGMENTLLLPYVTGVLGGTSFQYGLQEGLTSICFVIGSLYMAKYACQMRDQFWIILGLVGMGVMTILYSYSTSVTFAVCIIALTGLVQSPYAVAWITLLQRNTDHEIRGRILGANMTSRNTLMILGMAAAGLADFYGARFMMQIAAWINLAIGIIALVTLGIGRPVVLPGMRKG